MKKRYLKIYGGVIWATDNLTIEDLGKFKNGSYDAILDLQEWKQFNPDKNEWEDIKGD